MEENYQYQEMETLRINQEIEQNRINQEMLYSDPPKSGNKGWIVVLVFLIISIAIMLMMSCAAYGQTLTFADREIENIAVKLYDTDNDGKISKAEADSIKGLNLTSTRTYMFTVKTYDDLPKFQNLEKVWLGESTKDTVDLSKNFKLKFVNIQSDNLKVLILAVGCTPTLHYPMHSGEVVIKRVLNPDAPGAMFFQY